MAVAFDVNAIKPGVPRSPDIHSRVADERAVVAAINTQSRHRLPHRLGIGFPAKLVGTADDGIKPIVDIEMAQHGVGQKLLAVGDEADRCRSVGERSKQRRGVIVEIGRFRALLGLLDLVEGIPERIGVDTELLQGRVSRATEAMPEDLGFPIGEPTVESLADAIEDIADIPPLRIDDRTIEIEQPEVVGVGDHRPKATAGSYICVVATGQRIGTNCYSEMDVVSRQWSRMQLDDTRIAMLVGPGFEDLEFWAVYMRMQEEGATIDVVGTETGVEYTGKSGGLTAKTEVAAADVDPAAVDAVLVPGGWTPDKIRRDESVCALVRAAHEAGTIIGLICHAGLVGISAGIVDGSDATGSQGIKDDLINAGANWVDEPAFRDGNIVWGRVVADIPEYNRVLVETLAEHTA